MLKVLSKTFGNIIITGFLTVIFLLKIVFVFMSKVVVCDIFKCGYTSWRSGLFAMEGIYRVEQSLKGAFRKEAMKEADRKLRLKSEKNKTLKKELWKNSLKVQIVYELHEHIRLTKLQKLFIVWFEKKIIT